MDRISYVSDDLLLKMLSSLPTKDVIATTLLSKRWKFLWTMVPRLDFDDKDGHRSKYGSFVLFVDRVMVLHKAPVLETLKFKVGLWCNSEDMSHWIRIGIVRHLRELDIISHTFVCVYNHQSIIFPRSLYMHAKLEVLKLTNMIVLDVPTAVYLLYLTSLHLMGVDYNSDECHRKLLAGGPVLEKLVMDKGENFLKILCVEMPSLERLSILDTWAYGETDFETNVVINAPFLKYLNIADMDGYDAPCI